MAVNYATIATIIKGLWKDNHTITGDYHGYSVNGPFGISRLVLLMAVIAIVKFLAGWLSRSRFTGMDHGLMAGFSGLMDLQVMLGLILLVWSGMAGAGFPLYRIAHGSIMILAGVVAHLSVRWRDAEDFVRFRSNLFLIAGSIILVLLGIVVLPGGLSR